MESALLKYWGKAGEGREFHPLVFHSLDVAATGLELLLRLPRLRLALERLTGLSGDHLEAWLGFFLAIHDLGKFSSAFQQLRPDLAPDSVRHYGYTVRHDTLGFLFWIRECDKDAALLGQLINDAGPGSDYLPEIAEVWARCVTGHHGQPPKNDHAPLSVHFSAQDLDAARWWTRFAADWFLGRCSPSFALPMEEVERRLADFSWWLAGLCTLADWLGSNQEHFPFRAEILSLDEYWVRCAQPQATAAVHASGIVPVPAASAVGPHGLFDFITAFTPLQQACLGIQAEGPGQLFILEDVTGAGKTEAAFLLLSRLLSAGVADGAYVALPTMATANSMYRRTAKIYRDLFDQADSPPSLVLAHGARYLDAGFRSSIVSDKFLQGEGEYGQGEPDAEARCNAWLADNNKKALLAQVGVGTIDQALLAVLKSRHQSLRLLGLLGKVLVVDEVHASDAYMHRLLCELLRLHSSAGGSAILLSATLPRRMRAELLHAWGLDTSAEADQPLDYPLLTSASSGRIQSLPIATRSAVRRALEVQLIHHEERVFDWIVSRARAGSCLAWVRNTVDDAIRAYESLVERLGSEAVVLFHARFALGDRLDIENRVLEAFGKDSKPSTRTGRVVVATQVVEQSLDLDFDEMVSDLAPIDLLLQRAGRLRRHARDSNGNSLPSEAPDQRGPVILKVLTPAPEVQADAGWIRRLLPGTAAVYSDHARLWLTASVLFQRKCIGIPDDLREVIEAVFGEAALDQVPDALQRAGLQAEGQRGADSAHAVLNAISRTEGYQHVGGEWWDESRTPTRLGEPSFSLRLAVIESAALKPIARSSDQSAEWSFSEVRVSRQFLPSYQNLSARLVQAVELARAGWPRSQREIPLLVFERKSLRAGGREALSGAPGFEGFCYCPSRGLQKVATPHAGGERDLLDSSIE